MKIGLEHLYGSAYFNLKTRLILLKTKMLQTRTDKLGCYYSLLSLRRMHSKWLRVGVKMLVLASFLVEGCQVISDGEIVR